MITSRDKELLARLIKKYAGNTSTDALLAYIADNNGMLAVCKLLVQKNNEDDREVLSWVDGQCYAKQVDLRQFLFEIQQIISVFQPGQGNDEYYSVLGLDVGASDGEIKEAYRKLSLLYHPDTSNSTDPNSADIFIKINKAYQALLNRKNGEQNRTPSSAPAAHWRQENRKRSVSPARKKKNIIWFSALTLAMVIVSIMAARGYQQKAMITGLQLQQAAFIPPGAVKEEGTDQTTPADEPVAVVVRGSQGGHSAEKREELVNTSPMPVVSKKNETTIPQVLNETAADNRGNAIVSGSTRDKSEKSIENVVSVLPEKAKQKTVTVVQESVPPEIPVKKNALHVSAVRQEKLVEREAIKVLVEEITISPSAVSPAVASPEQEKHKIAAVVQESVPQEIPVKKNVSQVSAGQQQKTAGKARKEVAIKKVVPVKKEPGKVPAEEAIISSSAVSSAVEHQEPIPVEVQVPMQLQLEQFLTDYIAAYKQKDLQSFSKFFTANATENDVPFHDVLPAYVELFEKAGGIDLKINILKWSDHEDTVQVDGHFTIRIVYTNGKKVKGRGTISFVLSNIQKGFLVEKMTYQFDEQ